ncbi:conserved hypothetical protein [Weissella viridescens]|nr:conserved hypothetical protein [Weissella viridescens]
MYKSIEIINSVLGAGALADSIQYENQNKEYEGVSFPNKSIRSRLAKRTPKKKGYFVACYISEQGQKNRPYTLNESLDYLVVCIDDKKRGAFIFPKEILASKGILTSDQLGKMAFRVYPPFETDLNKTATATQKWQSSYYRSAE